MNASPFDRPIQSAVKVRVLHLLLWIHPAGGGTQMYMRTLVAALADSIFEVEAGALMPGSPTPYLPQPLHLGTRGKSRTTNAWSLLRWLWNEILRTDLVHIHGVMNWPFLIGCLVCRINRVPYVVSTHGQITQWFLAAKHRKRRAYVAWIAAPLLKRAQTVIATTQWEKNEIVRIVPGVRVKVVAPGVQNGTSLSATAKASDTLHIVFVGQFTSQKGIPTLLKAVSLLRAQGANPKLVMVGRATEPAFDESLRGLVADLQLQQAVEFPGYLQGAAKQAALQNAHVFALPSYMENFSFATAEALMEGIPTVVSTEVALAETILRYDCGSVVPPDDPESLASALAQYSDSAVQRARGHRARQCALAEFSIKNMKLQLEELYRFAIAAG